MATKAPERTHQRELPFVVKEVLGEGGFTNDMFVESFDLLVDALGGTNQLCQLVLELAIRGNLFGVGRPSMDADEAFALPIGWRWASLDEVCSDSFYGPRFGKNEYVTVGGVPTIRTTDMTADGRIDLRAPPRVTLDPAKRDLYLAKDGDLLVTRTGSIGTMAVFRGTEEAIPSAYLIRFRFHGSVIAEYVYVFLKSSYGQNLLGLGTTRVAQPNVNATTIRAMRLPIPPLAEQKRIVERVNQLMGLIDELEAKQNRKREVGARFTTASLDALTRAEGPEEFDAAWKRVAENWETVIDRPEKVGEVRRSILELAVRGGLSNASDGDEPVEAQLKRLAIEKGDAKIAIAAEVETVDDPFALPAAWRWVKWGDLVLATSSGWSPQCDNRPRGDGEWGVLKVSAVSWDVFQEHENKALPKGIAPRPEFAAHAGDFLMSRANTAELVGRSVIVTSEPTKLLLSDKLVRCAFSKQVEQRYVNIYNRTSTARAHYLANASGTSDSMKNISRGVILSMPVPLPPLAEQKRIVAKVEHLMKLCDQLEAALRRSDDRASKLVEAVVQEMVA